jgi:hypothetical protein
MADATKSILSLIATTSDRVRDLVIKDGQLIFCQDVGRIAFDFKGKRVFYNQIVEIETEAARKGLENPMDGYYFVIDTGVFWNYHSEWTQITNAPQEVVFIGIELPTLGQANTLYANTTEGAENISVWDDELGRYVVVADKTQEVSDMDILELFN